MNIGCFAVETLRLIDEVGVDREESLRELGISVAGLMSASGHTCDLFHPEVGGEAMRLAFSMNECDRIVGYGIKRFDLPVLEGYFPCTGTIRARSIDLMEEVRLATGTRVSLSNLCRETLGRDLPMAGIQSPLEWRAGNRGAVARRLTEKLAAVRDLLAVAMDGDELCFVQSSEGGFEVRGVTLRLGRLRR